MPDGSSQPWKWNASDPLSFPDTRSDLKKEIDAMEEKKGDIRKVLEEQRQRFINSQQNDTTVRKKRGQEELFEMGRLFTEGMKDEVATIKDEEQPVLVGSISYFWGEDNLPEGDNATDCADFSPANDAANYTICNMTSMIRCQKSLSEVVIVGKKKEKLLTGDVIDRKIIVMIDNETVADSFAWFCPPSDKCCEWECCSTVEKEYKELDPPDKDFVFFVHTMALLAFSIFMIAVMLIVRRCVTRKTKESRQEREQQVELQPLNPTQPGQNYPRQVAQDYLKQTVNDYPKQQRSNPNGSNYGWHPKPSAPTA